MGSRLEILKSMVEQKPGDSFARYGLAMELRNSGDLEGAMREFDELRRLDPDYSAQYFHAGQTLERLGRIDEARAIYQEGIQVTSRKGDLHAKGELQGALDLL
jgi:tetratricopeptide (TPR) repeat protein